MYQCKTTNKQTNPDFANLLAKAEPVASPAPMINATPARRAVIFKFCFVFDCEFQQRTKESQSFLKNKMCPVWALLCGSRGSPTSFDIYSKLFYFCGCSSHVDLLCCTHVKRLVKLAHFFAIRVSASHIGKKARRSDGFARSNVAPSAATMSKWLRIAAFALYFIIQCQNQANSQKYC